MTYFCNICKKEHSSFADLAIAFDVPFYYDILSEEEKRNNAKLNSDFCIIHYEDQTDRFIRCVLSKKIIDSCQELEYGLWVSVSEKSYQDYWNNFNNEDYSANYFGWISNHISEYDEAIKVPVTICVGGKFRPKIIPHQDYQHSLVTHYYKGITEETVKQRINQIQ